MKIVQKELSNIKNVKHHVMNADLDEQMQKQDLNLKNVHVVYQEILQLEKVRHNVMNALQENIQVGTVVKLVIVVHQEHQTIFQNNHHVLVVERDQDKIKHVKKHAIYVIKENIKMVHAKQNVKNVLAELNVIAGDVKNVRVVRPDHMLIVQVLQHALKLIMDFMSLLIAAVSNYVVQNIIFRIN